MKVRGTPFQELVFMAEQANMVDAHILKKEADLIRQGKRPMCLFSMPSDYDNMHAAYCVLDGLGSPPELFPFIIERGDGAADYGFAKHHFYIPLLEFLNSGKCPDHLMHAFLGLMLGYDSNEVADHYHRFHGKRFNFYPERSREVAGYARPNMCPDPDRFF